MLAQQIVFWLRSRHLDEYIFKVIALIDKCPYNPSKVVAVHELHFGIVHTGIHVLPPYLFNTPKTDFLL